MGFVLKIAVTALAVWVAVRLVGGLEFSGDAVALIAVAVVLALVNAVVRPVLTVLSLPFVVLTLGLFLLVVNAAALGIAVWISEGLGLGLTSSGFGALFLGALVITVVSWVTELAIERIT